MSKYTKEQLQAMSDFEVDKALTELLGFKLSNWFNNDYGHYEVEGASFLSPVKNYCNTPNDIMPLAFEHGVYYYNGTACTTISDFIDGHVVFDEPFYFDAGRQLRAIACCLILVLQEKLE